MPSANAKEQFDLLYDSLANLHAGFVESAFKVTGFLLVVVGWIVTSTSARSAIGSSMPLVVLSTTALVLASCLYLLSSYRVMNLSQNVYDSLVSVDNRE